MKIESPLQDEITVRSCCAGSDVEPLTVMAIQPRDRFIPQSAAAVACFTALCHTVLAQKGNSDGARSVSVGEENHSNNNIELL